MILKERTLWKDQDTLSDAARYASITFRSKDIRKNGRQLYVGKVDDIFGCQYIDQTLVLSQMYWKTAKMCNKSQNMIW